MQVSSWTGGEGTPPASGQFLGSTGLVGTAAEAVDIRGSAGAAGADGTDGADGAAGADGADGAAGADGDDGWSPVFAAVSDGERRVLQVTSWTGGGGTPPMSPVYLGATGFVTDIAQAVDIRGAAGAAGSDGAAGADGTDGAAGADGTDGDNGWSPVLAVVTDTERRVLQINSWTGGEGTAPTSGQFIGPMGLVATAAEAVDIRGAQGDAGTGRGFLTDFAVANSEFVPVTQLLAYSDLTTTHPITLTADNHTLITDITCSLAGIDCPVTGSLTAEGYNSLSITVPSTATTELETNNDIAQFQLSYRPATGQALEVIRYAVDIASVTLAFPTTIVSITASLNFGITANFNTFINRIARLRTNTNISVILPEWEDPDWDTTTTDVFAFLNRTTTGTNFLNISTQGLDIIERLDNGNRVRAVGLTNMDRGVAIFRDATTIGRFFLRQLPVGSPGEDLQVVETVNSIDSYILGALQPGVPVFVDTQDNRLRLDTTPTLGAAQNLHGFIPTGGVDASDGITPVEFSPVQQGYIDSVTLTTTGSTFTPGTPVFVDNDATNSYILRADQPSLVNTVGMAGFVTEHVAGDLYNIYVDTRLFDWTGQQLLFPLRIQSLDTNQRVEANEGASGSVTIYAGDESAASVNADGDITLNKTGGALVFPDSSELGSNIFEMDMDPFPYGIEAYPSSDTVRHIGWRSSYTGTRNVQIDLGGVTFTLNAAAAAGPNTASFTVLTANWSTLSTNDPTGFQMSILIDSVNVWQRFVPVVSTSPILPS